MVCRFARKPFMNTLHAPKTEPPASTTQTPKTGHSCLPEGETRSRFHPGTWSNGKKTSAALLAAVVVVGGWAAFRPERLFVNQTVNETLPSSGVGAAPTLVSQGAFSSGAHATKGSASLYGNTGSYVLRLTNFSTSNGPDVHVYAVEGAAGNDDAKIKSGGFLDLGSMKGNIGDQNYALPANFDAHKYGGVSIWCKRFAVNFGSASLQAGAPAA